MNFFHSLLDLYLLPTIPLRSPMLLSDTAIHCGCPLLLYQAASLCRSLLPLSESALYCRSPIPLSNASRRSKSVFEGGNDESVFARGPQHSATYLRVRARKRTNANLVCTRTCANVNKSKDLHGVSWWCAVCTCPSLLTIH